MTWKRKSFSFNEKHSLLEDFDKLPETSQRDAAVKLGAPQAALYSLLEQRETVRNRLPVMETENKSARRKHLWLKLPSSRGLIMSSHVMPNVNSQYKQLIKFSKAVGFITYFHVINIQMSIRWSTAWYIKKKKKFFCNNHLLIVINSTWPDVITIRGFHCTSRLL